MILFLQRKILVTSQLRIQHAIGIALSKSCVRELVVALEWSENGNVLAKVCKWAEEPSKQDLKVNLDSSLKSHSQTDSTLVFQWYHSEFLHFRM